MTDITLTHAKASTTRKGWASLKNFSKRYAIPGGETVAIRCYEDLDYVEQAWAAHTGTVVEPETHEPEARPSGVGQPRPSNPGEAEAMAYIANYSGTFGLILDLRADRRFGSRYFHLSDRQIEVVLASKAREAQWAAERAAKVEAHANAQDRMGFTAAAEPVTEGMYRLDGTVYKVQRAVNGSGHLYAKVLIVEDGSGRFEYAQGAIRRLSAADRMSVEQAQEFGHLYGVCCVCGRTLTDEGSIAAGIGPVCSGKGFAA